MGCNHSRLEDLPAVALCRDRRALLDCAIHRRRALSQSHSAYMQSLSTLALSLHRFFQFYKPEPRSTPDPPASPHRTDPCDPQRHRPQLDSDSHSVRHSMDSSPSSSADEFHDPETLTASTPPNYSINTPVCTVPFSYPSADSAPYRCCDHLTRSPPPPPPPAAAGNSDWGFLNIFEEYERYEFPLIFDADRVSTDGVKDETIIKREAVKESREGNGQRGDCAGGISQEMEEPKAANMLGADKVTPGETKDSAVRGVSEIMKEVELQLERASKSGSEVSVLLHNRPRKSHLDAQNSAIPAVSLATVSSPPSLKSLSLDLDDDEVMECANVSSAIEKLYIWETKLYNEVKAEEKLRMIHDKKCRELKSIDLKNAEPDKTDSAERLVMNLSTKINISIQVVDQISISINKLRDEELWPEINDLINGFLQMWKVMLESHRSLSKSIREAVGSENIASNTNTKHSGSDLEAMIFLKSGLMNWNRCFSDWVASQKGYAQALDAWLQKCLFHEPRGRGLGLVPLSATDMVVPPVFMTCNRWSEAMEGLLEAPVMRSFQAFFHGLNRFLEQHDADLQQRMMEDREMERRVKMLEREEQKMRKMVGEVDDYGNGVNSCVASSFGLILIFEAMESFSEKSREAYEQLCISIDEDPKVPP